MSQSITITVPLPPNLANARMHHMTKHRAMKRYFKQLDARQNGGLIPPPPAQPWPSVVITAEMRLAGRMDDENAKYRCYKWPCDWLKTRGYLVDDKQPYCTMRDPVQVVKRLPDWQYEITLTLTPTE
jgi:hypothetical protein